MKLKAKILFVEWVDAVSHSGWSDTSDLGIATCFSVGFLVKEDNHSISLASAISESHCNAVISIPKGWIKKKKTLKY